MAGLTVRVVMGPETEELLDDELDDELLLDDEEEDELELLESSE